MNPTITYCTRGVKTGENGLKAGFSVGGGDADLTIYRNPDAKEKKRCIDSSA